MGVAGVLVIHRNLRPVLARTRDVAKRADWPQISVDVHAIRHGTAAITATGNYTQAP